MPDHKARVGAQGARQLGLNPWWRASAAALGLAGMGSGAVAVYVTRVEAGPVMLILAGLISFLVGASGRIPSLRSADIEADYDVAVRDFVTKLSDDVPVERTPELVDALGDLAQVAPRAAAAALGTVTDRTAYEYLVKTLLTDIAGELPPSENFKASANSPLAYATGGDFQIRWGERLLIAEIRYRRNLVDSPTVRQAMGSALGVPASAPDWFQVLLVSNQPLTKTARDLVTSAGPTGRPTVQFQHVVVRAASDAADLRLEVRRALRVGSLT
jgi:hypothetical protein